MSYAIKPWEPSAFPDPIQSELDRRKFNRGFTYNQWSDGDWQKYKGPMSPWVRFCSNSNGPTEGSYANRPGFVLCSGKNFYADYGFKRSSESGGKAEGVIGYMPNGTPHIIINDINTSHHPIHVPPPEITKIDVTIQKELYRRASIEWVCFSSEQLKYMTPYFLIPGISCILEWGWNHFDTSTLLDLNNISQLQNYNDNPYPLYTEHILKSKGNYDVLFGRVTNFDWSVDGNKIHGKTEVTSQDRIYAGIVTDSTAIRKKNATEATEIRNKVVFDDLHNFVNNIITSIKEVKTTHPADIDLLKDFYSYLKSNKRQNYIYGAYWGRDPEIVKTIKTPGSSGVVGAFGGGFATQNTTKSSPGQNRYDFDYNGGCNELWITMGLLVEIINYHSSKFGGLNGKEIFRIDIDDVVIGGHPNLISTDGKILLIPNAKAPRYFYGNWGTVDINQEKVDDYTRKLSTCDLSIPVKDFSMADERFEYVCSAKGGPEGGVTRDDLDKIINMVSHGGNYSNIVIKDTEFPSLKRHALGEGGNKKGYLPDYSGYLKNLYFNAAQLKLLTDKTSDVKTYSDLIQKILTSISTAAGNFWDLRLVGASGKSGNLATTPATLTINDNNFMGTINGGKVYTFDYMDADSLLLGLDFKPTLSNAQAIRTIYSSTNNPEKDIQITNGEDELLNYKFKDRLYKVTKNEKNITGRSEFKTAIFETTLKQLQGENPSPSAGQYQVTLDQNHIHRLVFPAPDILKLILNDGDLENNPKYCGVMPGIQSNFTIQGIGGLRTFMCFLVRNLPEPYSNKNIVFRITDVKESIESGKWTTVITAGLIPLRNNIRERLGIETIPIKQSPRSSPPVASPHPTKTDDPVIVPLIPPPELSPPTNFREASQRG